MQVEPYLFFDGRCEEALEFYRQALGAEIVALLRFKDSPDPAMRPPGGEQKVMHALFRVGTSALMASDGENQGSPRFQGFALSLTPPDVKRAGELFNALSEGGHVQMPLSETFWSPCFGMVTDRFGIVWMINVLREPPA